MFAELKSKIKQQKSIHVETGKEAKECNEKKGYFYFGTHITDEI